MKIGSVIRTYRTERNLTQEQLAEDLHVTVSAVSQWESGKTTPDVELLPAIAGFFGISLDALFGRLPDQKQKDFDSFSEQNQKYAAAGDIPARIALWRAALQSYPGDFSLMYELASALSETMYAVGNPSSGRTPPDSSRDGRAENAREAAALCERILRVCPDQKLRNDVLPILVSLYSNPTLPWADEEKAVQAAESTCSLDHCREILLEHAYFTEESRQKRQALRHSNRLRYIDRLAMSLYYDSYSCDAEKQKACETALLLWEMFIPDGNYLFYHCRIQKIYELLAICHARAGKAGKAADALKKALFHAEQFDALPEERQFYTAPYVRSASGTPGTKNYTFSNREDVLSLLRMKTFDAVRADPAFAVFRS